MTARVLVIIVALGLVGLRALELRQRRLDAAHRMVALHQRMEAQRETTWRLRTLVAEAVDPADVRERMSAVAELGPIPREWGAARRRGPSRLSRFSAPAFAALDELGDPAL